MDYIKILKDRNIKFKLIDEDVAKAVIEKEVPFHRLVDLSAIFEKYNDDNRKDQFVNLSFEQLYCISLIDEELSYILLKICLQLELQIKTILIDDANKLGVSNEFLKRYISLDNDFLNAAYPNMKSILIMDDNASMSIDHLGRFLDLISLNTLERVIREFYKLFCDRLTNKRQIKIENYMCSLIRVRNKVAHSIPILCDLCVKCDIANYNLTRYLKNNINLGSRTIHNNLSRLIEFDICNLLFLYCNILPAKKIEANYIEWQNFLNCLYEKYRKIFKNQDILESSYNFFKQAVIAFSKEIKKTAKNT